LALLLQSHRKIRTQPPPHGRAWRSAQFAMYLNTDAPVVTAAAIMQLVA